MAGDSSKVRIEIEAAVGDVSKIEAALKSVGAEIDKTSVKTEKFKQSATETNSKLEITTRTLELTKVGLAQLANSTKLLSDATAQSIQSMMGMSNAGIEMYKSFDSLNSAETTFGKISAGIPIAINAITFAVEAANKIVKEYEQSLAAVDAAHERAAMSGVNVLAAQRAVNKATEEGWVATKQYATVADEAADAIAFLAEKKREEIAAAPAKAREEQIAAMQAEHQALVELTEGWQKEIDTKKAAEEQIRSGFTPALQEEVAAIQARTDIGEEQKAQLIDEVQWYQDSTKALLEKKLAAGELVSYTELMNAGMEAEAQALEAEQRKLVDVTEAMYGAKDATEDMADAVESTAGAVEEAADSWDTYVEKMRASMDAANMWAQDAASLNAQIQAGAGGGGGAGTVGHSRAYWEQQAAEASSQGGGRSRGGGDRSGSRTGGNAALQDVQAQQAAEELLLDELHRRQQQAAQGDVTNENLQRIKELIEQLGGGL